MKHVIGILWWSWPEAGLYITHLLHLYLQETYHASEDGEYPDYILYNKPLAWFGVTGVVDEQIVIAAFKEAITTLIHMWATIIGVACNTLHLYREYLQIPPGIILCNLVDVCVQEIGERDGNVLILSSETTTKTGLYAKKIPKSISLLAKHQTIINGIIQKVMWNTHCKKENDLINEVIKYYQQVYNIQYVIVWCTELPLAFSHNTTGVPVLDANRILAKTLVETYRTCHDE